MNLDDVRAALTPARGTVAIDTTTLGSAKLAALVRTYYSDSPIVISSASFGPGNGSDAVVIQGISSFLGAANVAVLATVALNAGQTDVVATFKYSLIGDAPGGATWSPQTSFSNLPSYFDPSAPHGDSGKSFLDYLTLRNASFVVCTDPGTDAALSVPLSTGINFIAALVPDGTLGLVETFLNPGFTPHLYGTVVVPTTTTVTQPIVDQTRPWQLPIPAPGVTLQADLGFNATIGGKLTFSDATLHLYTPLDATWLQNNPTYMPSMGYSGKIAIPSAALSIDVASDYVPNFSRIVLSGTFTGFSIANLAKLADIAGADDLQHALPSDIGTDLGDLQLTEAAVCLSLGAGGPIQISYTYFTIGMPDVKWTPIEGFTISAISATFLVRGPFAGSAGRSLAASLGGTLTALGAPFDVRTDAPGFFTQAQLASPQNIPLRSLMQQYAPSIPPPTDLSISELVIQIQPGSWYSFAAGMADNPPWTLNVGFSDLTISNVSLGLVVTPGSPTTGTFGGAIAFGDFAEVSALYTVPGAFVISGTLSRINVSQVVSQLCDLNVALPGGFNLVLMNSSVLIREQGGALTFMLGTQIKDVGSLAFQALKAGGKWGFAFGIDLSLTQLYDLPGLADLKPFTDTFRLDELLIVASSIDQVGFQFPSLAQFNNPNITAKNIALPKQASGLAAGLSVYAQFTIGADRQQNLVAKLLGIPANASLGITLQVSENPAQNSKLFATVSGTIGGTSFAGTFGGIIQSGEIGLFLTGTVSTTIQGQPVTFGATLLFVENGAFISGSMVGGPISFLGLRLANVAIEIGVDWEGIPSLGFAAEIVVGNFNASVAIFLDSADPAKSLLAGAISDVSLKDVAEALAQTSVPAALSDVLAQVAVKGTQTFDLPSSLASDLNELDLESVSSAFATAGVPIPSTQSGLLVIPGGDGSSWFLTDLTTMKHYELKTSGAMIAASLEAQLYIAPQLTQIGLIQFPQGFRASGEIDFFGIKAVIDAEISQAQGVSIEAQITPFVIYSADLLQVTGANGQGGPQLSVCSYTKGSVPPHFYLSAQVKLAGVVASSIFVNASTSGLQFDLKGALIPGTNYDVHGNFASLSTFSAGGSAQVGIDTSLDFGKLGSLKVDVSVAGSIDIGYNDGIVHANVSAQFNFQGTSYTIVSFTLDITKGDLANLGSLLLARIELLFSDALKQAEQWLEWIKDGVISGIDTSAAALGSILNSVFGLSASDIASDLMEIMGFDLDDLVSALRGAGESVQVIAQTLYDTGSWTVDQISAAISSVFGGHADINLHIDNQVQQHLDQAGTAHNDSAGRHDDQAGNPHSDGITGNHIDSTRTNWDGSKTHQDQGGTHNDIAPTAHLDTTGPHTDISGTPHLDTPTQHQDQPDHGDNGK